jgi:mercuric reductase
MEINAALERLNQQLPLKQRQDQLKPELKRLHQAILHSLATRGHALTREEIAEAVGIERVTEALVTLGKNDLVVLNEAGDMVVGAYPLTTEATPHKVRIGEIEVNAMCALDAVSVAPMFGVDAWIESSCHITRDPVQIHMRNHQVIESVPLEPIVAVRWQMPCGVAAHSMCMEMVFIKDQAMAEVWQSEDIENISLFKLPDAVEFGSGFFMPLMD